MSFRDYIRMDGWVAILAGVEARCHELGKR